MDVCPALSPAPAPAPDLAAAPLELAVVVPTYNEAPNVLELVRRLDAVLQGVRWEVVFVDDNSADGTAALLHALSCRDARVRCLKRVGRRGLSSACIEGMLASGAPLLAVMDADLQHDESLLPQMLQALREPGADGAAPPDLVVGSRYVGGGGVGDWQASRQRISRLGTQLAQRVLGLHLSDPMSGFFMLRRSLLEAALPRLSSLGFKILVDLVASSPQPPRVRELPFTFRTRLAGHSKLDGRVAWDFAMLLVDKTVGRWLPPRLVAFGLVGAVGVGVHLAVLRALLALPQLPFVTAQAAAVLLAMVSNFQLNNMITYRDQRLHGWRKLAGLAKFVVACSVGAVANVGLAASLNGHGSGWLVSGLAGIIVGTVWNYGATAHLVWSPGRRG